MSDLFSQPFTPSIETLAPGIVLIKGLVDSPVFLNLIQNIINQAPLRHMMTPMGHPTKVAMSNCGPLGWVSSLKGYDYSPTDPISNLRWPTMPHKFIELAQQAANLTGLTHFLPDACLINQYEIGHNLGRHQDKDEADFQWPIVSVSIGLPAVFQIFPSSPENNSNRSKKAQNILLQDGDILVLHGPARLRHHAIKTIKPDLLQPNLKYRYNLTFRKAR